MKLNDFLYLDSDKFLLMYQPETTENFEIANQTVTSLNQMFIYSGYKFKGIET